jgi:hypothetical protein
MTDDDWGEGQLRPSLERILAKSEALPRPAVVEELKSCLQGLSGKWDEPINVSVRFRPGNRVIRARLHVLHTEFFTYEMLEANSLIGVPDLILTSIYSRNSGSGVCWLH